MVDRYRQRFILFAHYLVLSIKKNYWQTISAYHNMKQQQINEIYESQKF